jgi:hypothetical protein
LDGGLPEEIPANPEALRRRIRLLTPAAAGMTASRLMSGMTERNRSRLRQFDDPENVCRLIRLPEEVFRSLPRSRPPSFTEAIRVQSALAV